MNKEQAKKLLPIIKAFTEDKKIQYLNNKGEWEDQDQLLAFYGNIEYRIKPRISLQKGYMYKIKLRPCLIHVYGKEITDPHILNLNPFWTTFLGTKDKRNIFLFGNVGEPSARFLVFHDLHVEHYVVKKETFNH